LPPRLLAERPLVELREEDLVSPERAFSLLLPGVRLLALSLVHALGELLGDLGVEGFEVVRFAAGDEALVDRRSSRRPEFGPLPQRGLGLRGCLDGGGLLAVNVLALPAELEGQGNLNLLFRQAPRACGPRRCRLG
jgi:hypothetical protein